MDEIIPWDEWVGIILPFYYKAQRGRPPKGVALMLRMYLLQIWFHLSDEGLKDAINRVMVATGHMMKGGTIVDATIVDAPSSTKNAEKKRNPEMHQTKKGGQWRFGMKCHIGVDAGSGLVHTIEVTAANEHDVTVASRLIREDDEVVYGDSGYLGIQKREEIQAEPHLASIHYRINRRPRSLPKVSDRAIDWERYIERRKSSVRCKVEYAFRIIKRQFGFQKVPYRGLEKNENRLYALFACANLYMLALAGRSLCEA